MPHKWIIRHWHRFQLARELLAQYEWDEAHRVPFPEALRRLTEYAEATAPHYESGVKHFSAAVKAKLGGYPSG